MAIIFFHSKTFRKKCGSKKEKKPSQVSGHSCHTDKPGSSSDLTCFLASLISANSVHVEERSGADSVECQGGMIHPSSPSSFASFFLPKGGSSFVVSSHAHRHFMKGVYNALTVLTMRKKSDPISKKKLVGLGSRKMDLIATNHVVSDNTPVPPPEPHYELKGVRSVPQGPAWSSMSVRS